VRDFNDPRRVATSCARYARKALEEEDVRSDGGQAPGSAPAAARAAASQGKVRTARRARMLSSELLEEAGLWRGVLLDGCDADWMDQENVASGCQRQAVPAGQGAATDVAMIGSVSPALVLAAFIVLRRLVI
jgi:hypothetical protein